jgi:hypothetical protein
MGTAAARVARVGCTRVAIVTTLGRKPYAAASDAGVVGRAWIRVVTKQIVGGRSYTPHRVGGVATRRATHRRAHLLTAVRARARANTTHAVTVVQTTGTHDAGSLHAARKVVAAWVLPKLARTFKAHGASTLLAQRRLGAVDIRNTVACGKRLADARWYAHPVAIAVKRTVAAAHAGTIETQLTRRAVADCHAPIRSVLVFHWGRFTATHQGQAHKPYERRPSRPRTPHAKMLTGISAVRTKKTDR